MNPEAMENTRSKSRGVSKAEGIGLPLLAPRRKVLCRASTVAIATPAERPGLSEINATVPRYALTPTLYFRFFPAAVLTPR
jgi:hypothetical protein